MSYIHGYWSHSDEYGQFLFGFVLNGLELFSNWMREGRCSVWLTKDVADMGDGRSSTSDADFHHHCRKFKHITHESYCNPRVTIAISRKRWRETMPNAPPITCIIGQSKKTGY